MSSLDSHIRRLLSDLAGCFVGACTLVANAQPDQPSKTSGAPAAAEAETGDVQTPMAPEQNEDDAHISVVTTRRGGFAMGFIVGPSFGWAGGNPSDKAKQDRPEFERKIKGGFGYRLTPFFGGALTDWFTFGLGASLGDFSSSKYASGFGTFVFHLEVFPLFAQGGVYRDLGLAVDFGAGTSSIRNKSTGKDVADSGVMSTAGLGVFWEPLRAWKFAGGPYVGYQRNWSRWYSRNDVTGGLRLMFYTDLPE